ncbi:hypothetical protein [Marinospirillum sp.]|uniref:hypothetical protein n=1 Tax=Marinospirillum sp. TaxID=2183934 RepID=UPI003A88A814
MIKEQQKEPQPRINHNWSIIALLFAFAAIPFGPWFLPFAIGAALYALWSIRQSPEHYAGELFVWVALGLSTLLSGLYLLFFLNPVTG